MIFCSAQNDHVNFAKIDIDELQELAMEERVTVMLRIGSDWVERSYLQVIQG